MRTAIIDIGTNTFNLLIADVLGINQYKIRYREEVPVKLGEGTINNGIIAPAPFKRGIEALKTLSAIACYNEVDKIKAIATSAIRNAENGAEFVNQAFTEAGIKIHVIKGDEEALYIYKGVKLAGILTPRPSLIMDIGGGSVEFIIASNKEIFWKDSFEIGVARLLQRFKPSDVISATEIYEVKRFLNRSLVPLFDNIKMFGVRRIIGCSGSFESFANMMFYLHPIVTVDEKEISVPLNVNEFLELCRKLMISTGKKRLKMKGLPEMRADTIVLAALMVKNIIDQMGISEITLSHFALKEGVLYDMIRG